MQTNLENQTSKEALSVKQEVRPPLTAADYGFNKAGYTIEETLALVPFGRTTLWNFISSGELPIMRFGRRVSIAAADLAELLNKRRGAFDPHQPIAA
jgi:hypothetical protein